MEPVRLISRDYNSLATAILSQNHRDVNIAESILVSTKVIIACLILFLTRDFPIIRSWGFPSIHVAVPFFHYYKFYLSF